MYREGKQKCLVNTNVEFRKDFLLFFVSLINQTTIQIPIYSWYSIGTKQPDTVNENKKPWLSQKSLTVLVY